METTSQEAPAITSPATVVLINVPTTEQTRLKNTDTCCVFSGYHTATAQDSANRVQTDGY